MDDATAETRAVPGDQGLPVQYDVVVVGGGAAGLSGATALARSRRSVLVVDAGAPRNAAAGHVHNYLGREGTPPHELLAIGRAEVAGYGGEVVTGRVMAVTRVEGGFRLDRDGEAPVVARRVLVTTGLVDRLPEVDGLADRWGIDVLHCPYCHGWEVRDQRVVILGTSPLVMHQALLWRQLTDRVTIVRHEPFPLEDEQAERLEALDVALVDGPALAVEVGGDRLTGLRLGDGSTLGCDAVVVGPAFDARSDVLGHLGLEAAGFEVGGAVLGTAVPADPMTGATAVPGVYVAGNVTGPMDTVIAAAAAGLRSGAFINADLAEEDALAAVAARRATAGAA